MLLQNKIKKIHPKLRSSVGCVSEANQIWKKVLFELFPCIFIFVYDKEQKSPLCGIKIPPLRNKIRHFWGKFKKNFLVYSYLYMIRNKNPPFKEQKSPFSILVFYVNLEKLYQTTNLFRNISTR